MKKSRFGGELFAENDGGGLLDGVANLADVMLVLACGLLLALVINWNVDITSSKQNDSSADEIKTEMEFSGNDDENLDSDTNYEELGTVYRDPATGKLYLIETEG
jgi:hypothetical protein